MDPVSLRVEALCSRAAEAYKRNWKSLAIVSAIFFVAAIPAQLPSIMQWVSPMPEIDPAQEPTAQQMGEFWRALLFFCGIAIAAFIYQQLFLMPLMSGVMLAGSDACRRVGQDAERAKLAPDAQRVPMMGAGFSRYGSTLGTWLLVILAVIVAALPMTVVGGCAGVLMATQQAGAAGASGAALNLEGWSLAAMITIYVVGSLPMAWVMMRLMPGTMMVADPRLAKPGAFDSLRWSWAATSGAGVQVRLVATAIVIAVGIAASALLLGVGLLLVGLPWGWCVWGAIYEELLARNPIDMGSLPESDDPLIPPLMQ